MFDPIHTQVIISKIKSMIEELLQSVVEITSQQLTDYSAMHHQITIQEVITSDIQQAAYQRLNKEWIIFSQDDTQNQSLLQKWICTQPPEDSFGFLNIYFKDQAIPDWAQKIIQQPKNENTMQSSIKLLQYFTEDIFRIKGKKVITISSLSNKEIYVIDFDEYNRVGYAQSHILFFYQAIYKMMKTRCGIIIRQDHADLKYAINNKTCAMYPITLVDLYGFILKTDHYYNLKEEELKHSISTENINDKHVEFKYKIVQRSNKL